VDGGRKGRRLGEGKGEGKGRIGSRREERATPSSWGVWIHQWS